jgi:DNA/RNA-binding domain of Phe-tRNA-synthetase-like protein
MTDEVHQEMALQYDAGLLKQYPDLYSGIIQVEGLLNRATPAGLRKAFLAEQQAVLARLGEKPLSELPALAAWRRTFRSFGVDPTKYRSSAEALLRRLVKKGEIPGINALVDAGNLVSIRYALPVAIFDRRALDEPVMVRFADGGERYTALDESEDSPLPAGEVIFCDQQRLVIARRWCWRQSLESAATADTRSAILTIEAQHSTGSQDVQAAVKDILELLQTYLSDEPALRIKVDLVGSARC